MLDIQEKAKHQGLQYHLHHCSCLNPPQLVESVQKCMQEDPVPQATSMQPEAASPHSQRARETQKAISTYI